MAITRPLTRYAGRKLTAKLVKSIPWIGAIVALITLRQAVRTKGFRGGTLDTALDFTPYVGTVKNLAEVCRGRDFIPDRVKVNS